MSASLATHPWNSLASNLFCRGPLEQNIFLWGPCVVSTALLWSPTVCPAFSSFISVTAFFLGIRTSSDAHLPQWLRKRDGSEVTLWKILCPSHDFYKWSPFILLCFIVIAGQRKNADRRTWKVMTCEKRKIITFSLLQNLDLIAYWRAIYSGLYLTIRHLSSKFYFHLWDINTYSTLVLFSCHVTLSGQLLFLQNWLQPTLCYCWNPPVASVFIIVLKKAAHRLLIT